MADLYPLQQLGEDARADLCAAAGAFGELRELISFSICLSPFRVINSPREAQHGL